MKPSLKPSLTLSQQLRLTPALRQALALLQDNSAMLEERLSRCLEENIFLERSGDYTHHTATPSPLDRATTPTRTLREYCLWQLHLSRFPAHHIHWPMAQWIADSLDDYGYLTEPLSTLIQRCQPSCTWAQAQETLSCIQQLEPLGLGARDAQEALQIQARHLFSSHPLYPLLQQALQQFIQWEVADIASDLPNRLSRTLSCTNEQADTLVSLLQQLNPKPGLPLGPFTPQYHGIDARITWGEQQWDIDLNPMGLPPVVLSTQNIHLFRASRDAPNRAIFTQQLMEARWLIQALQQRHALLKSVLQHVVTRQSHFLKTGQLSDLQALSLAEMATLTQRHPSSISRLIRHKWVATPVGDWPLSFFFQRHIGKQPISQAQLKGRIQHLIQQESPECPLSDQEIASQLYEKDLLEISRRTVAKYRQALAIPKASQRKRRS